MCFTHIYLVSLVMDLFYCFVIYYYVKSGDSLLLFFFYCHGSCFIITYCKYQLLLFHLYGMMHH